jgi:hypothetical protein
MGAVIGVELLMHAVREQEQTEPAMPQIVDAGVSTAVTRLSLVLETKQKDAFTNLPERRHAGQGACRLSGRAIANAVHGLAQ